MDGGSKLFLFPLVSIRLLTDGKIEATARNNEEAKRAVEIVWKAQKIRRDIFINQTALKLLNPFHPETQNAAFMLDGEAAQILEILEATTPTLHQAQKGLKELEDINAKLREMFEFKK